MVETIFFIGDASVCNAYVTKFVVSLTILFKWISYIKKIKNNAFKWKKKKLQCITLTKLMVNKFYWSDIKIYKVPFKVFV